MALTSLYTGFVYNAGVFPPLDIGGSPVVVPYDINNVRAGGWALFRSFTQQHWAKWISPLRLVNGAAPYLDGLQFLLQFCSWPGLEGTLECVLSFPLARYLCAPKPNARIGCKAHKLRFVLHFILATRAGQEYP